MKSRISTRDVQMWAACRAIAMHQNGGRCARCRKDDCPLVAEADELLKAWEAEHSTPPPEPAPACPPDARYTMPAYRA